MNEKGKWKKLYIEERLSFYAIYFIVRVIIKSKILGLGRTDIQKIR